MDNYRLWCLIDIYYLICMCRNYSIKVVMYFFYANVNDKKYITFYQGNIIWGVNFWKKKSVHSGLWIKTAQEGFALLRNFPTQKHFGICRLAIVSVSCLFRITRKRYHGFFATDSPSNIDQNSFPNIRPPPRVLLDIRAQGNTLSMS